MYLSFFVGVKPTHVVWICVQCVYTCIRIFKSAFYTIIIVINHLTHNAMKKCYTNYFNTISGIGFKVSQLMAAMAEKHKKRRINRNAHTTSAYETIVDISTN